MMALWAITSFKMLIPTALSVLVEVHALHVAWLFLPAQSILLNNLQQVLRKRRDGSNHSGDIGHSQGSWECGNTTANAGEGSAENQSDPATRMLSAAERWGEGFPTETWLVMNRKQVSCSKDAVIPEKQCKGCKISSSVKALTYPKSTVDFHSLSTNINTGTCRQATIQAFPSEITATWLTARGSPL